MGNKSNDAAREPRLSPSIKDLAAKAKQAAVKAQGTVLKAVDKNGNGKIDAEDFGINQRIHAGCRTEAQSQCKPHWRKPQ